MTGKRVRQTRRMMRHRLRLSGLLLLVVTAGALAVLSGTRGVGKPTIARIFAKALNCVHAPTGEPCNQCEQCRRITMGNHAPQVMNLPFVDGIRRADRDNAIDLYMGDDYMDVLADDAWPAIFKEKPEVFTREAKREWLDKLTDVALGSDAFFPFGDNIERAHKSGVKYIAQPGGSIRDKDCIDACNRHNMVMSFTGIRLFHH